MSSENNQLEQKPNNGFKPGVSGNPAGRPRGTKTRGEKLFDKLMASKGGNLNRIIDRVLQMAEEGDSWACRAILDRVWIPPKGRVTKINLGGDPTTAMGRVIAALEAGDVTASEARDYIDVLKAQAELIEARDLEARLAALEREAAS